MIGRRIFAVVFIVTGIGLIVFSILIARGAIDQTVMRATVFQGLAEGPPVMYFILGAATTAFGLYILIATFLRR